MKRLYLSFRFASEGVLLWLKSEKNFLLQVCMGVSVLACGLFFKISSMEWIAILICCAIVLSLEMMNTAIEQLADAVDTNHNIAIKRVKDIAAGAVMLAAIVSTVIALIIFIPKILNY